ncbi:MAG: tetratricopeptide repeat protein, partial [Bacteroidaceae bacterium]|nr:tetratricopeptide repeat protein [Bacteroidaceae bacterium]
IISAFVAVIVVIAGGFSYKHYITDPQEKMAAEAIFRGEAYLGQDNFEKALNGDSIGYMGFIKIADEFSGTKSANLAKAYAGICNAQLGNYKEAIDLLSDFSASDEMISPATIGLMGDCYVNLNKLDEGLDAYLKAADKADNAAISPVFLKKAGLLYEKLGKFAEAVETYTTIKNDYFKSPLAGDMDKYIERATLLKK